MTTIYRQGDVVLELIPEVPEGYVECGGELRMKGETGNDHVLEGTLYSPTRRAVETAVREKILWPLPQVIEVGEGGALIVHPEHPALTVLPGIYKARRARTSTYDTIEEVVD